MKSLYNIIHGVFESRERLGKLPLSKDELESLAEACYSGRENDEIYIRTRTMVVSRWGEGAWNALTGWLDYIYYTGHISKAFKTLKNIPIDRLAKMISAGSYGAVLNFDKDKVIKWFHDRKGIDKDDKAFYMVCMKNGGKGTPLPKVYRIGKHYVVMEKLLTNTSKCKQYSDIFEKRKYEVSSDDRQMDHIILHKFDNVYREINNIADMNAENDFKDLQKIASSDKMVKEVMDWYMKVHETYVRIKPGSQPDIRLANIGERPSTHEIVAFDI